MKIKAIALGLILPLLFCGAVCSDAKVIPKSIYSKPHAFKSSKIKLNQKAGSFKGNYPYNRDDFRTSEELLLGKRSQLGSFKSDFNYNPDLYNFPKSEELFGFGTTRERIEKSFDNELLRGQRMWKAIKKSFENNEKFISSNDELLQNAVYPNNKDSNHDVSGEKDKAEDANEVFNFDSANYLDKYQIYGYKDVAKNFVWDKNNSFNNYKGQEYDSSTTSFGQEKYSQSNFIFGDKKSPRRKTTPLYLTFDLDEEDNVNDEQKDTTNTAKPREENINRVMYSEILKPQKTKPSNDDSAPDIDYIIETELISMYEF